MMKLTHLSLLLLASATSNVSAFSSPALVKNHATATSLTSMAASNDNNNISSLSSRREALNTAASAAAAFLAVSTTPFAANADVTNKIASSSALRTIKRALRQLSEMEMAAVSSNDYTSVKESIRKPPLTEVRRNCMILIKGGEDGPDAENLQAKYAAFIKELEGLDSQASLGIRGRKNIEMAANYDGTVKALKEFLEVAERSAELPVQYDE